MTLLIPRRKALLFGRRIWIYVVIIWLFITAFFILRKENNEAISSASLTGDRRIEDSNRNPFDEFKLDYLDHNPNQNPNPLEQVQRDIELKFEKEESEIEDSLLKRKGNDPADDADISGNDDVNNEIDVGDGGSRDDDDGGDLDVPKHNEPPQHNVIEQPKAFQEQEKLAYKELGMLVSPDDNEFKSMNPGDMGKPFELPKDINPDIKKLVDEGYKKNAFNQYISDLIPLKRSLPDTRSDWCKKEDRFLTNLPKTSVIVCFHNEAFSVLARTVHSVLDRSPPHLIEEIILVDDFSDMPHLAKPLEDYFRSYPKVKIVRAKKREGLIRARLLGFDVAKGPVLTYLDSHCECTDGWLEPLLDRIARDNTTVVCPVIDDVNANTLKYSYTGPQGVSVGGFDWNLVFRWYGVSDRERKRHKDLSEPLYSPTMAGGLFSIDKEFFRRIGTYDPGFDIWGGENLELSFKTWMCGGTLEIVPCSHVGHIFRKRSPYKWREGVNVLRRNNVRLAEVWLDEYAKYYYQRSGKDKGEYGDISARKQLRDHLHCKSFKWYIENIYPEIFIPGDAVAQGDISNKWSGMCVDSPANSETKNERVNLWPCHQQGGNQYWLFSKNGEIRRDETCLDHSGGEAVNIYPCHGSKGNQLWRYDAGTRQVVHASSNKCLAVSDNKKELIMEVCDASSLQQKWDFENYDPSKL